MAAKWQCKPIRPMVSIKIIKCEKPRWTNKEEDAIHTDKHSPGQTAKYQITITCILLRNIYSKNCLSLHL